MRILVIGAAGRTGVHIVEQALGHGHEVRALVHTTPLDLTHARLEKVTGDVLEFDAVRAAVTGVDAVAFAVGAGSGRSATVYSEGIANVVHAMAANEVERLAAISAAGAFARTDKRMSLGFRTMIATVLRPVYDDMERMEQRIAASGLDWTIVRAGGLGDGAATGHYRVSRDGSLLPKMRRVARADLAAVVLKALETGVFSRQTLVVAD